MSALPTRGAALSLTRAQTTRARRPHAAQQRARWPSSGSPDSGSRQCAVAVQRAYETQRRGPRVGASDESAVIEYRGLHTLALSNVQLCDRRKMDNGTFHGKYSSEALSSRVISGGPWLAAAAAASLAAAS